MAETLLAFVAYLSKRRRFAEAEVIAWRGMEILHADQEDSDLFMNFINIQIMNLAHQRKPLEVMASMKKPDGEVYIYVETALKSTHLYKSAPYGSNILNHFTPRDASAFMPNPE